MVYTSDCEECLTVDEKDVMRNKASGIATSASSHELDLSMLLIELWEGKWIILLFLLVSLSLGAFYISRQVPEYQAELLLQIKSNRHAGVNFSGQAVPSSFIGGNQNDQQAAQIALIKSRFILAPVVKSLGLDIHAVPIQSRFMKLFSPLHASVGISVFEISSSDRNEPFQLVFEREGQYSLYNATHDLVLRGEVGKLASNQRGTIRLRVDAVHAPPHTAFSLTKTWDTIPINELRSRLQINDLGTKFQTGVLALWLNHSNPEVAVKILNVVGKTVQAKDAQRNAMEASKTLDFLFKQLPITKHDLEKSELALNRYRSKNGTYDIKFNGRYLLRQLVAIDSKLDKLSIEKIDKLQKYTEAHPYLISLETKVNELKHVRVKLEAKLRMLPAADQIAVNLMRDVKVKNDLYMVLLNKIQELQVVKAGIVSDIRILSLARLPHEPLPRGRKTIYVLSLFLGLMLSAGVIYVRKLMFPSVDDPHWSERQFNLVNLAVIPYSKEQLLSDTKFKSDELKQLLLLAHLYPKNLAIESLRSLRTTLQIRLASTSNQVVSIMGVSPGIGKTFVSANLAYLLATSGRRVVVIDSDMRRGTLHKYYNVAPELGLAEMLAGKKTLAEVLLPTVHENLMLIPRGTYPDSPAELLGGQRFQEMISQLTEEFDIVLIDTPPVLLVTDAVLIGVHSGTNYLVIGSGVHQPLDIEMTIKRLTNAGLALDGSIFNHFKPGTIGQKGYYKYGYKYSYYYDDKEPSV